MSLLTFESFDSWLGSYLSDYELKWTIYHLSYVKLNVTGVGRRSTFGVQLKGQIGYYAQYDIGNEKSGLVFGFAFRPMSGGTPLGSFLELQDSAGTSQFVVDLTAAGRVRVKTANGGSVLAESSDGAVTFDIYQFFEIKFTVDSSSGTVQVRVDGSDVIASTGSLNTRQAGSGGVQKIKWHSWSDTAYTYLDDLYLCDLLGAKYNDFLGDVKVDVFWPDADGNYAQFAPNTGSDHYAVIDDNGDSGITNYIEEDTVGQKDSFTLTPTGDLPTIHAIGLRSVSKNSDTGVAESTPFVRMSGVDYDQTPFARGDTIEYDDTILTARPDTGGVWTKALLESMEFGWEFSAAS